jgi:hypothetical protein
MRHFATFLRQPEGLSDRGEREGEPIEFATGIPVAKRAIGGREAETARQLFPTADFALELHGPCNVIPNDIAIVGSDRLLVGYVEDVDSDGRHFRLLCAREQVVTNG